MKRERANKNMCECVSVCVFFSAMYILSWHTDTSHSYLGLLAQFCQCGKGFLLGFNGPVKLGGNIREGEDRLGRDGQLERLCVVCMCV